MIGHKMHVRRKERLIEFMHTRGDIGPPEKSLRVRRPVVKPHFQFHERPARIKTDAVLAAQTVHRIVIAAPYRDRAIRASLDLVLHRHEGSGPVMLRPVEFHSARNPRPGQANERRLNYVLTIKEIVAVCFVQSNMDAASNLGQDHQPQKFVLKMDCVPQVVARFGCDAVGERQWIDAAAAPLIDPHLKKHGIRVGRHRRIGWQAHRFNPRLHCARLISRRGRKFEVFHVFTFSKLENRLRIQVGREHGLGGEL